MLLTKISTPMNAHYTDILQQDQIRRNFLDRTSSESYDEQSSVPSADFERGYEETLMNGSRSE